MSTAPRPFQTRIFVLQTEIQVRRLRAVIEAAWEPLAAAGRPLEIVVGEWRARRHAGQNRHYWRRLNEIADQVWIDGRRFGPESWHEVAKRKFIGYQDLPTGGVRALSSAALSVEEFSEYVTQVEAWAAEEHGVQFSEKERQT